MAVLGLDFGTSGVKALVLGDDGDVLGTGQAGYDVLAPRPGWAEGDPERWLSAAEEAVRAARPSGRAEPIRALGLSGQMHGVVPCTADGTPTRPALLWPDRRATAELDLWRALPHERRRALANPLAPGMAGPLLAWLVAHEPDALARARWALPVKDWVRLRLTGVAVTEPTDASATLLWDVPGDAWAHDVAEAAGIDPELLAPVKGSGDVAGELTPHAADALGLPAGLPVHAGAADTAAALLGAAIETPARRLLNLGTGAQLVAPVAAPDAAPEPATQRFRAVSGWYAMAAVQNAGLALGWVRAALGMGWQEAEGRAFADPPPDTGALLFLPQVTGERTDPGARGGWVGAGLEHGRDELVRAAYEGVAHLVRAARDALEAEAGAGSGPFRLLGGGSLRPGYRQLMADTLGVPLDLLEVADASARGAALLAGGTAREPAVSGQVEPDGPGAERAAERHTRWAAAVAALSPAER